jgi:hypothetical protein
MHTNPLLPGTAARTQRARWGGGRRSGADAAAHTSRPLALTLNCGTARALSTPLPPSQAGAVLANDLLEFYDKDPPLRCAPAAGRLAR